MADSNYVYDPNGTNPANKVINERHNVQPPANITDASMFFLRAAPAFQESLVIRTGPASTATRLVEGQDYILTHQFLWKSYEVGKPIYCSVTMVNRDYTGELYVDYQTLGGAYVLNDQTHLETLSRDIYRTRYVYWEQVAGQIPGLPPFDHSMSGSDTVGWGEVVDAILRLAAAIIDTSGGGGGGDGFAALQQHIASTTAHTLAHVGGNNLFNYPIANDADYDNQALNRYCNPAGVEIWVRKYIATLGLGTAAQDITQLKQKVQQIELTITQIQNGQVDFQTALDTLAAKQDDLEDRQTAIEQSVADAVADIPVMKDDIQDIKDQLSTGPTGLEPRVATLETKATQAATDIDTLQDDLTNLTTRVVDLENGGGSGMPPDLPDRVTTLETQMGLVTTDITALKVFKEDTRRGFSSTALTFVVLENKTITIDSGVTVRLTLVAPGNVGATVDPVIAATSTRVTMIMPDGSIKIAADALTIHGQDVRDAAIDATSVSVISNTPSVAATDTTPVAGTTLSGTIYGSGGGSIDGSANAGSNGPSCVIEYTNSAPGSMQLMLRVGQAATLDYSGTDLTAVSGTFPGNGAILVKITNP